VKILQFPIISLICLLAGCQTRPVQFQTPTSKWQTETGQLQYSTPKRSIIGETVVTTYKDTDFQFDFLAGPGFPIMKLRLANGVVRAEAAFAKATWQGSPAHAPGKLKPWLGLQEVFSQIAKQSTRNGTVTLQSPQPGFWHAKALLADGRPEDVTVDFPASRDQFVFHFNH
jgi:hypothetical protein